MAETERTPEYQEGFEAGRVFALKTLASATKKALSPELLALVVAELSRELAREAAPGAASPAVPVPDAHRKAAERFAAVMTPVPLTDVEQLPDPDFGAAPPAPSGWQPISTAPRDGTNVLLWWPFWCPNRPTIGWFGYKGIQQWVAPEALERDGDPPTHWQPLPPAPPESHHG